MNQKLSWALILATYKRLDILMYCISAAVRQSRLPFEIIVIDASPEWKKNRSIVIEKIAVHYPLIRWIYVQAENIGASFQRNQGIRLSTSDILFLIDDDSFMFPDCADKIMQVYEADLKCEVAGISGNEVAELPELDNLNLVLNIKEKKGDLLNKSFFRQFLKQDETLAYPGLQILAEIPSLLKEFPLLSQDTLHGAKMTFRRKFILKTMFNELMIWFPLEDWDLSLRIREYGVLVMRSDANMCHLRSGVARLSELSRQLLIFSHRIAYHRLHSQDLFKSRKMLFSSMIRGLIYYSIKDLIRHKWDFPNVKGVLFAFRNFNKILSMDKDELQIWYPAFQRMNIEKV
jgi:GT2 family glycosyltransferase